MDLETPKSPIKNKTRVQDKRDGKLYQVVAGFGFEGDIWKFLCWPIGSKNQNDCVTIEEEHLIIMKIVD